ncbi:MAG: response regulator, partial [Myxococcales bacterium]|nr:response regulator [Myxococcales bacterium]
MSPLSVLVVEDNGATRRVLRDALASTGLIVLEARDGTSALDLFESHAVNLVLVDLLLPDMDGFELAKRLRAMPNGNGIPIVAVSGLLSPADEHRLAEAGFTDLLLKPIAPSTLLPAVDSFLSLSHARPQAAGEGRRVLVVDDDQIQLRLGSLRLSALGYEVTTASDGRAALELARQSPPDAIVSDVLMPELDGFGLCVEVRRDPALADVPVVLVSSHYLDESDRALGLRAGANAYVARTPTLDAAVEALHEALTAQAPRSAPAAEGIAEEHAGRVVRQLEKQVALNSRLAHRAALQATELALLGAMSTALTRDLDIRESLDEVLAACLDAGGISRGAMLLREPGGELVVHAYGGFAPNGGAALADFFGHPQLLSEALDSGQLLKIPGPQLPSDVAREILARANALSLLIAPIVSADEPLGALLFISSSRDLTQTDRCAFARTVAGQVGQAIALARAFGRVAASEERFRSLVAAMEEVVFEVDHDGVVVDVHGVRLEREGLDPGQYRGRHLLAALSPAARAAHEPALARALAGETVVFDWSTDRVKSGLLHFQTSLSPRRGPSGDVVSVVGVARDVTDLRRAQAAASASERMATLGMLAAGVAHELNNPLTSVISNVDYARRELARIRRATPPQEPEDLPLFLAMLGTEVGEPLADAEAAAERVRTIVRDMRVFSRADEEATVPVDVRRAVESSLRLAWNEIRHRARLVKQYEAVPPVEATEGRLGQVILNILVNAAQALPEGHAEHNEISVRTRLLGDDAVAIDVIDTGPGIPPATLERIFDPFFTTKPSGVGTGLGLVICQRIVTTFGGRILVDSEVGRGTTFTIVLPIAEEERAAPAAAASKAPAPAPAPRRGRILCIDDEPTISMTLKRLLQGEHDVTTCSGGEEALALIAAGERYDVVLC